MKRGHKNAYLGLTAKELRRVLRYDPETGNFFWRVTLSNRIAAGKKAGWINRTKNQLRIKIAIENHDYMAHRLAWLYMTEEWPKYEIDHENLDGTDNRWTNLREATSSQNQSNRNLQSNNKTGYKGVCFDNRRKMYLATIKIGRKQTRLGHFRTPEEAYAAYRQAAAKLHGKFSRLS